MFPIATEIQANNIPFISSRTYHSCFLSLDSSPPAHFDLCSSLCCLCRRPLATPLLVHLRIRNLNHMHAAYSVTMLSDSSPGKTKVTDSAATELEPEPDDMFTNNKQSKQCDEKYDFYFVSGGHGIGRCGVHPRTAIRRFSSELHSGHCFPMRPCSTAPIIGNTILCVPGQMIELETIGSSSFPVQT